MMKIHYYTTLNDDRKRKFSLIHKLKIIMSKKSHGKNLRDLQCLCVCTPTYRHEKIKI